MSKPNQNSQKITTKRKSVDVNHSDDSNDDSCLSSVLKRHENEKDISSDPIVSIKSNAVNECTKTPSNVSNQSIEANIFRNDGNNSHLNEIKQQNQSNNTPVLDNNPLNTANKTEIVKIIEPAKIFESAKLKEQTKPQSVDSFNNVTTISTNKPSNVSDQSIEANILQNDGNNSHLNEIKQQNQSNNTPVLDINPLNTANKTEIVKIIERDFRSPSEWIYFY